MGSPALLIGDVGGTNCRLARFDGQVRDVEVWSTQEVGTLGEAVDRYLTEHAFRPDAAVVAVAGPVLGTTARLTNTDWSADAADLPCPTRLINDLHAAARGIRGLSESDVIRLGGMDTLPDAPVAVMGIGTGLGQALLVGDVVVAGEGGHVDFAPSCPELDGLHAWLRGRHGRVSAELVLSGPGLGRILAYATLLRPLTPAAVAALEHSPPGAVVFDFAETDPTCAHALDLFLKAVGSEAGNLALRFLGGVYLCGGILPRISAAVADGRLRTAFEDKPPHSALLATLPCSLITHPHLGLIGAAVEASRLLGRDR
ncbi:MAG: glucokinase [Myxococcota bacterium]|jgi:glucokinase